MSGCRSLSFGYAALVSTILFVAVGGLEAATKIAPPRLVCPKATFDFGRQPSTNSVHYSFTLKNDGDAPLKISKVRKSCGSCTVTRLTTNSIPAHGSAQLSVDYHLKGFSGRKTTSIYIHTNDPRSRIYQFKMTGSVIPVKCAGGARGRSMSKRRLPPPRSTKTGFRFDPGVVSFGSITNSTIARRSVLITSTSGKEFQVTGVVSNLPGLQASIETLDDNRKYLVHVSIDPFTPAGEIEGELRLSVKDYRDRHLNVPVSGSIVEDMVTIPETLYVSSEVEEDGPVLTVISRTRSEFSIKETDLPLEAGNVEVVELPGNEGYQLKLSHEKVEAVPEGTVLTIKTDIEGREEIKVPIRLARLKGSKQ